MKRCPTCNGATWVQADTSDGMVLMRCYSCQRAGRQPLPEPPRVFPLIPQQLHPMLRRAMAGSLGSLELSPGRIMHTPGPAVIQYAASYAMSGNPEHLERLEEIRAALERTPAEPEKPFKRVYDVTGRTFQACRTCRTPITFMPTDSGRHTPVETSGKIHWPNCPGAKKWRKTA